VRKDLDWYRLKLSIIFDIYIYIFIYCTAVKNGEYITYDSIIHDALRVKICILIHRKENADLFSHSH
jgi:hypothetical protein